MRSPRAADARSTSRAHQHTQPCSKLPARMRLHFHHSAMTTRTTSMAMANAWSPTPMERADRSAAVSHPTRWCRRHTYAGPPCKAPTASTELVTCRGSHLRLAWQRHRYASRTTAETNCITHHKKSVGQPREKTRRRRKEKRKEGRKERTKGAKATTRVSR